ncbi:TetR/AcrR family transcriptional regulator [Streptomyces sp. NPDC052721]|uniref:TetR/AcrR family transcriptional regulator n=1 Tax=Streptomyces sp. NPDC052721 TaxID=3154955 RepID=UPI003415C059
MSAAFSVFAAKGYGKVSIEEICAEAGFSRGAFYSNFETVDELFQALYEEQAAVFRRRVATVFETAGTATAAPNQCSLLIGRLARVVLSEPRWLLLEADARAYAARRPAAAQLHLGVRRRLAELVADGLTAHGAVPSAPGRREDAIRFVIEAYDAVTSQLILDGDVARARERFAHLLLVLASPAGQAARQPAGVGRTGQ